MGLPGGGLHPRLFHVEQPDVDLHRRARGGPRPGRRAPRGSREEARREDRAVRGSSGYEKDNRIIAGGALAERRGRGWGAGGAPPRPPPFYPPGGAPPPGGGAGGSAPK